MLKKLIGVPLVFGDDKIGGKMFYRLYSGDDGKSHMEVGYSPPESMDASSIVFRKHEAGNFMDWHVAPRRQFIVTLAGKVEIGLGDGTKFHLGVGDIMLAEDISGQGHTTRVIGDSERISIAIPVE